MMKTMLALVVLTMGAGCATGGTNRDASIGYKTNSQEDAISLSYSEHTEGRLGWFAGIAAGGQSAEGDELGDKSAGVQEFYGPDSAFSNETGSGWTAGNLNLGVTYQANKHVSLFAGPSVWIGEGYSEHEYENGLFGVEGKYHVDQGSETIWGALIGIKFLGPDEHTSLGVTYDTGTEMIGLEVGFTF